MNLILSNTYAKDSLRNLFPAEYDIFNNGEFSEYFELSGGTISDGVWVVPNARSGYFCTPKTEWKSSPYPYIRRFYNEVVIEVSQYTTPYGGCTMLIDNQYAFLNSNGVEQINSAGTYRCKMNNPISAFIGSFYLGNGTFYKDFKISRAYLTRA